MDRYAIYYNPDGMEELCRMSPFNLKNDLKSIGEAELNRVLEAVANELYYEVDRPPTTVYPYWGKGRKAAWGKIRTMDIAREKGKSGGYRCIVLADSNNKRAFLLHIYRHAHGEEENIDRKSQNRLRKMVDEYISSLENEIK